jgi:ketosteroid isomerase-like protein
MVFPDFTGRIQGREDFLAGFRDFLQNSTIQEFREHDHQIDVAGDTAVITFRYDMVYERSGERYRSTGRDLWVFQKQGGAWIAVWRTMLDMEENAA